MKLFANNPDVTFGDVLLSEEGSLRGEPHNPGQGGWPTIRYFNKKTGVEGANYQKKTSQSMCEELGDIENMISYIVCFVIYLLFIYLLSLFCYLFTI